MVGGIYSAEKCPLCGGGMRDNGRNAVCCPEHPKQKALNLIVRFGRQILKRFTDYQAATRFLNGLRFKTDEGSFDARDYQRSNPLGFDTLSERYLEVKAQTVKPGTYKSIRPLMGRCRDRFAGSNVKEIGYAEIEDFLLAQKDLSGKTRHNLRSVLHDFFTWLVRRRVLRPDQKPEFPEVPFQLGSRKTIDKDTQEAILEEVRRLSFKNPRIYLGIKWLATYINVRPGELRGIIEEDIDLKQGLITIRNHKTDQQTSKLKFITLLPEDVELIRKMPKGFPSMPFFRRDRGSAGKHAGTQFGRDIFYVYWQMACKELGIEGIDLYGGTRHSSARALRKHLTPEGIRRLTGHETNKAFERYYQVGIDELREGYALTRRETTEKGSETREER
jgi:integrase